MSVRSGMKDLNDLKTNYECVWFSIKLCCYLRSDKSAQKRTFSQKLTLKNIWKNKYDILENTKLSVN